MLYISLYFKTYRKEYYRQLNDIHYTGDWEKWLDFFADAVIVTANQAVKTAKQLRDISEADEEKIQTAELPKPSLAVYREFVHHPITTATFLSEGTHLSPEIVNKCLENIKNISIIDEMTDKKINRIFVYTRYFDTLNHGLND